MQCQFLFCLLIFSFHWKRFVNSGARNDFTRTINRIIYARCIKWMNTKCVPFHCLHILGGPARAKHFGFRASCYYSSHQLSLLSLLSIMLFDLKRYEFIYNIRCARTHLASCCTPPVAIFFFIIILFERQDLIIVAARSNVDLWRPSKSAWIRTKMSEHKINYYNYFEWKKKMRTKSIVITEWIGNWQYLVW